MFYTIAQSDCAQCHYLTIRILTKARTSSPFNSPSRGGYWTPINRVKRKYFPFYSNSLGAILSPSRGGCVRHCVQAGGEASGNKKHSSQIGMDTGGGSCLLGIRYYRIGHFLGLPKQ